MALVVSIRYTIFSWVSHGLFERHKLLFVTQLAMQYLERKAKNAARERANLDQASSPSSLSPQSSPMVQPASAASPASSSAGASAPLGSLAGAAGGAPPPQAHPIQFEPALLDALYRAIHELHPVSDAANPTDWLSPSQWQTVLKLSSIDIFSKLSAGTLLLLLVYDCCLFPTFCHFSQILRHLLIVSVTGLIKLVQSLCLCLWNGASLMIFPSCLQFVPSALIESCLPSATSFVLHCRMDLDSQMLIPCHSWRLVAAAVG